MRKMEGNKNLKRKALSGLTVKKSFENSNFSSYFCILIRILKYSESLLSKYNPMPMIKFVPQFKTFFHSQTLFTLISIFFLFAGENASGVTKTSVTAGNWTTITWSPAGAPAAGDDVIINTNVNINTNVSIQSLQVNSGFTLTFASTQTFTVSGPTDVQGIFNMANSSTVTLSGAVTVGSSGTINTITSTVIFGSTVSVSGTLTDNNSIGSNRFDGLVTVASGGTFNSTLNSAWEFRGGIDNSGTFSITGTGNKTFSTNNQSISGGTVTINQIIVADITLTNNATNLVIATSCDGTTAGSNLTQGTNSGLTYSGTTSIMPTGSLTATASGNTVTFAGATPNIRSTTGYFNLSMTGSGSRTIFQNLTVANVMTVGAGVTFQGSTFNITTSDLAIAGDFSKSGAGSILVTNETTLSGAGRFFNLTGNPTLEFQNGITSTSTGASNFGAGTTLFSTNNQNLSGSGSGTWTFGGNVLIGDGIVVTNQRTAAITITGTLDGTTGSAQWINDVNSSLTLQSNTTPFSTTGTLTASGSGNTVTYSGGTFTVFSTTYHNLTLGTAAGTKTIVNATVNGNLNNSGGTLTVTGTLTFATSNTGTFTISTVGSINNVIVNKSGGVLTMAGAAAPTINGNLQVSAGTLNLGTTARTLTVNGDLSGSGAIDLSGIAGHILVLNGANNSLGTLTTISGNSVTYNRAGDQTIFGSPNYARLYLSNSGIKTLGGNIKVSDTLAFRAPQANSVILSLQNSNATLSPTAFLVTRRSDAGVSNAPFSFAGGRYILTNGTGVLIKEGTTAAELTGFVRNGAGTAALTSVFPLATTGFYSPYNLTSLSATVTGTGSIAIRAVANKQPNVPYFNNALLKYWEIATTHLSGISANMTFAFNAGEVIGSVTLYEPRVWNGVSLATVAGPSAPGSNPFSTTGTTFLDGSWTALDPTVRNAFYSYVSGDWNTASTWTTDPSGTTLINSAVPGSGDQVFILNGRTVTNSVNGLTTASLTIENGGTLDMAATTGHNFGPVSGSGTYRQSTVTLPTANFALFVAPTGGTFEYYNLPSGTHVLDVSLTTYNILRFTNSTSSSYSVALDANLTTNAGLSLLRTGTGGVTFTIGNSATARTVTILGNLTIGAGTTFGVGIFAVIHSLTVHGNLSNSGNLILTNVASAYVNPTTGTAPNIGAASLTMRGATTNTTCTSNSGSTTRYYTFTLNKNFGFELLVSAATGATPDFWANGQTVTVTNGTLRLGANITIGRLTAAGNYDLGTSTQVPTLWIDGATVDVGGDAFVIYGTLRVSAGTFNCVTGQGSIVPRETGQTIIEGGTVNTRCFRTSNTATTHRGSYSQSGGTMNINAATGAILAGYSVLTLPYPENVFQMSGGVINITRSENNSVGGIQLGSTPDNYAVTGGTINVNVTSGFTFIINSTVPFWDLNIAKNAGAATQVTLNSITGASGNISAPANPLVVLNDLTITGANSPIFNAINSNVTVGRNFVINTGGTYQTTTNTTIFNGTGAQTFTVDGSLSSGLSSMTVNKTASTLTMAGSASSITLRADLNLTSGILADGGKTINVAGNIAVAGGSHSGAGKVVLNGSTASQTISGLVPAVFGNLDFSNTNGATGSAQITLNTNLQVNGNLGLTTDRITEIGSRTISLAASSVITGTFSSNRHIRTGGFLSDGGISKPFNSTAAFTFPLGYGTNYAPATIQFTAAPTTWGTLDVRPVGTKQLYVTDPDCFDLYWKIKTTGFSGIPANSINYTFNYGNLPDNTSYIPAFYDQLAIAYIQINDVTQVNETTNNIHFTGVSYTDGDYTAGNPLAFGTVTPYYSRQSGNWNNPNTWSNVAFGGAPSATIPASNSPVLIGDGNLFNHTVTVTSNGTISGSLIVDAGSTLDCQTTTGNNFGAIPYATAGGSGRIRISSAAATAEFPAGDFGLFFQAGGGTCEYYSTGTQDFVLPSATAAPTSLNIDTYRNLVFAPGAGRTIEFPNKNMQVFENVTVNGSSTGVVTFASSTARTLLIDGNLTLTQGILEMGGSGNQIVQVAGNTSIANGGTLRSGSAVAANHSFRLNGNLLNEGIISLNNTSTANLLFQGPGSRLWNGADPTASVDLSTLTINKGTSQTTELEITTQGSLTAPTNNWLTLINGTLRISRPGNLTLNDVAGFNFVIPATSALVLNHSGLTINAGMANNTNSDLQVAGRLSLLAGTMNIGNSANTVDNDLEYSAIGFPEFNIEGSSTLNINGHIRRSTTVQLGSLKYSQKDNSTVLVRGRNANTAGHPTLDRAKFEILNAGSEFNMSGNTLLTISRSGVASGSYKDIWIEPSTFNISGGEIRVGAGITPTGQNFLANINCPLWNLSVDGTTNTKTLTLDAYPLVVQRNLRIEGNSVLNTAGLNVTIGGDLVNQNTSATADLVSGGYRAANANQVTTFNGSSGSQSVTGVSANLTNFAILQIANTFTGGSVSLSANTNIRVAGQLSISNGTFNTGANTATVSANVVNNSGHTSSGSGFLVFGGTVPQAIQSTGTASFGSIRISNSSGVNAECNTSISGTLNLNAGLFYINNFLLSLGSSATVTGSFNSATMIRLNGVTSDGGVTKAYPASASDFTFPIGVTLRYTPARFNVTSNAVAGSINIKPVAVKHPATTDPLDLQLNYYWRVASTGFSGATTVNHTYTYEPTDVTGTETNYVTGRFISSVWAPTLGIAGTVDPANDRFTLTGVNYFNGDYTAGEPSEFNILTTFYSRNATLGGNWDDPNSWSIDPVDQHDGVAAPTFPNFNQVVIAAGHTIAANGNGRNAISTTLNGILNLGNSIAHNFGNVTGTGRMVQTATAGNQYIFPGGDYSLFTGASGGTFEFGGTVNGTLSTQATYNHVEFSGTATKSLPNANISLNGNLTISAGVVNNPSNRNISLNGNWTNSVGVGGFSAGTGTVTLSGGAQNLSGSTNFSTLATTGAGIKTLASSMTAASQLTLTSGIFNTGANEMIVSAGATISGGSSSSYVNGNLRRAVAASTTSLTWPIGDGTAYTPVTVGFTGTTTAGGSILANTTAGDHPQIYTSGVDQTRSANRFWTLSNSGVGGFTAYSAAFTFVSGDLDGAANPLSFIVARYSSSTWTQPTVGTVTSTSTQGINISGTVFGDFQVGQAVDGKIWTGATNTNWNVATNWVPVNAPTASENAIIGNVPNQPTFLSGGNGFCQDLVLLAGSNVTIPSGYTLNVNRNIDANGNTIDGTGILNIASGTSNLTGSLTANCNVTVAAPATLVLTAGSTLNCGRNLTINGTLNTGTLPVNFTGGTDGTVSGAGATFYNMVINKNSSSNFVQLGSNVSVTNQLNLQTGDLELNNFQLNLGTTGSLINETVANRVNGISGGSIRAVRTLNSPAAVNVGGLGAVLSSSANLGSTEVIRKHNQVVFGIGFGINRRYEIHPTNNTALNATLEFSYFDDELITGSGTIVESELVLWRFNGTTWDAQGGTLNMAANTITKSNIPQFSEWTAGSEVNNPLGLELAYFRIDCQGKYPIASWQTLKESEILSFRVEGSIDGKDWLNLGSMEAKGSEQGSNKYEMPLTGSSALRQVRLVLVETDGTIKNIGRASLSCNPELVPLSASIHPNPGSGLFYLNIKQAFGDASITVLNTLGQEVFSGIQNSERSVPMPIDLRGLPAGIYRLLVKDENGQNTQLNLILR